MGTKRMQGSIPVTQVKNDGSPGLSEVELVNLDVCMDLKNKGEG